MHDINDPGYQEKLGLDDKSSEAMVALLNGMLQKGMESLFNKTSAAGATDQATLGLENAAVHTANANDTYNLLQGANGGSDVAKDETEKANQPVAQNDGSTVEKVEEQKGPELGGWSQNNSCAMSIQKEDLQEDSEESPTKPVDMSQEKQQEGADKTDETKVSAEKDQAAV